VSGANDAKLIVKRDLDLRCISERVADLPEANANLTVLIVDRTLQLDAPKDILPCVAESTIVAQVDPTIDVREVILDHLHHRPSP
jgi:hypothetical protein